MATRIQLRRDTAANWTSVNPVLSSGEVGYETDSVKYKIGDGVTTWSGLDYFSGLHSDIGNLDYASAGHTGFQPTGDYATNTDLTTVSGLVDDNAADILINVDGIAANAASIAVVSGTADTNAADIITNAGAISDNTILIGTTSGTLQGQIDINKDHGNLDGLGDDDHSIYHTDARGDARYYQQSEVDTISGSLSAEIDSDIVTFSGTIDHNTILNTHNLTTSIDHNQLTNFDVNKHRLINDSAAGVTDLWSAQKIDSELDAVTTISGVLEDHNHFDNLDGGTSGEYFHLTASEHTALVSGTECTIHKHDDRYYTETEVDTISGSLNADININIGNIATNVADITFNTASIAVVSGTADTNASDIITNANAISANTALIATTSGTLQTAIDTKDNYDKWTYTVDGVGGEDIDSGEVLDFIGGDNITLIESGTREITISGTAGGGAGGLSWSVVDTDTTAEDGNGYMINASGGDILITTPDSPSEGDIFAVCDIYNMAEVNTITVSGSDNIEGSATPLVVNINGAGFELAYADATRGWEIVNDISTTQSGSNVHGNLDGLESDDHPQYHTDGRAATWLAANHETTYTHADIATNKTHVDGDGSDHTDVASNTSAIATNTASIAVVSGTADTNASDIITNANAIAANTTLIGTTSGTLQTQIDTNAGDISTNASDISDNASDIADNTTLITTTSGDIVSQIITDHSGLNELDYASAGHTGFQPAGDYATNTDLTTVSGLVDDNTADISTNASVIATNTASIAVVSGTADTNAADITTLDIKVDTTSGTLQTTIDNLTAADIIYDGSETVEHILDDIINTGVLDAITVDNDRGGLTIDWTGGAIFDHTTKAPTYTVSGTDTATDNAVNYLIWTTGTSLSLGVTQADVINDEVCIATIAAQDGIIHDINTNSILSERETSISDALDNILHVVITSGLVVSEHVDATNALDVECTAGVFYQDGHERHDVSKITSSGTLLDRDYKTGGVWDFDINAEIDTAFYNNGDNLVAAGSKWYKSLFIVASDHLHWVYPTAQYNTRAAAIAGALPTRPPGLALFPNSVALVYQGGDASLPTAGGDQWIDVRPVIGATSGAGAISDHGNLTGLGEDDHSIYHTDARGDARYYTETELDGGQLDNRYYTETEADVITDANTTLIAITSGTLQASIDTKDNYSKWTYTVDGAGGEDIDSGEVLDFIGGDNITLTETGTREITISGTAGGLNWTVISGSDTATTGNGYLINASDGDLTLTLPATPSEGDSVGVCDFYDKATTNLITIARNGSNIEGSAEDFEVDVNGAGFTFVYTDATRGWEIVSEVGGSGTSTLLELTDTPAAYDDGKVLTSTTSGTEWVEASAVGVSTNLLDNSGFGDWSNGTLENVTAFFDDNCEDDDTGDFTKVDCTMAFTSDAGNGAGGSNGYYTITEAAATQQINRTETVVEGKLYKMSVAIKDGTGSSIALNLRDDTGSQYSSVVTTNSWVTHTFVFEAIASGSNVLRLSLSLGGGETIKIDNYSVYEVTLGCVAADILAADTHSKTSTLDAFKFFNTDNSYGYGQFLLKIVKGAMGGEYYNLDDATGVKYKDVQDKQVAFGCFVYSVSADDNVQISIADGISELDISSVVPANTLTWCEVTGTVASNATKIQARILVAGDTNDIAYISQPILVLGSSIGEGNYSPKPTDPPILTGLESLEKTHGKVYVWDKDKGMVVETRPLQNLLFNSGFGVWSNSGLIQGSGVGRTTDFNVSNILTDTDGSTFASWTSTAANITDGGANLLFIQTSSATQDIFYELSGLTVGKLYKVSIVVTNGTADWTDGTATAIYAVNNAKSVTIATQLIDAPGTFSLIWEATEVDNQVQFNASMGAGETLNVVSIYVDEVTPGCVAANTLGPDGWSRRSTVDLWRSHSDGATEAVSKLGSFYALKFTSGHVNDTISISDNIQGKAAWTVKFAGRIVTFGAWVLYSGAADKFYLRVSDGVDTTDSDYHTGGGAWEWLEVTHDVNTAATSFYPRFRIAESGQTGYISQPMLVYGSSIGEGNYSQIPGEVISLEKSISLTNFTATAYSTTSLGTIVNLETESNGKIPKGIEALTVLISIKDSASSSDAGCYILFYKDYSVSAIEHIFLNIGTTGLAMGNNLYYRQQNRLECNNDGDFEWGCDASGSLTMDIRIRISAVQLR